MALITKSFTFSAGSTIIASEHNSNFDTVYNEVNGSLSNANIDASAAIANSKLNLTSIGQNVAFTGTLDFSGATITAQTTFADLVATTADINGGTLDDVAVGATVQSTGHFTTLQINSSAVVANNILDEDTMASDSATALASQQSIKAYVDNNSGIKLLSTTTGTGTNTGDITIAADKCYTVHFDLVCGGTDSAVVFAFNSDTTGTDYQYKINHTDFSDGTITNSNSGGAASMPLGTIQGSGAYNGKMFIETNDDAGTVNATFHIDSVYEDTSAGNYVSHESMGTYLGGAVTSFELQFSQSTTYTVRVYEYDQ